MIRLSAACRKTSVKRTTVSEADMMTNTATRSGFGRGPPGPDADRKLAEVRTNLRPRSKRGAQALMRAPKAVDY